MTRLSTIDVPALIVIGEHDIADVHAFGGALQAALPVVRREVWHDTAHLVQLERPTELVRRVEAFINVVEPPIRSVPLSTLRRYEGRYRVGNAMVIRNVGANPVRCPRM